MFHNILGVLAKLKQVVSPGGRTKLKIKLCTCVTNVYTVDTYKGVYFFPHVDILNLDTTKKWALSLFPRDIFLASYCTEVLVGLRPGLKVAST